MTQSQSRNIPHNNSVFESAREIIKHPVAHFKAIWELVPLRFRWILWAVVGVLFIGSATNIGLLIYAARYGARAPVEGVPFLSLTVGVVGTLLFAVTWGIIPLLDRYVSWVSSLGRRPKKKSKGVVVKEDSREHHDDLDAENGALSAPHPRSPLDFVSFFLRNLAFVATSVSIVSFVAELRSNLFSTNDSSDFFARVLSGFASFSGSVEFIVILITFTVLGLLAYLVVSDRNNVYRINEWMRIVGLLSIAAITVTPPFFDGFLRVIRFGGGIEVTIVFHGDANNISGNLFIDTRERIILYIDEDNIYKEYPREKINHIRYSIEPEWKLPKPNLLRQVKYFYQD